MAQKLECDRCGQQIDGVLVHAKGGGEIIAGDKQHGWGLAYIETLNSKDTERLPKKHLLCDTCVLRVGVHLVNAD